MTRRDPVCLFENCWTIRMASLKIRSDNLQRKGDSVSRPAGKAVIDGTLVDQRRQHDNLTHSHKKWNNATLGNVYFSMMTHIEQK